MIRNIISIFIIIISIVLILILFDRIIYKELFNVIKIRGNISSGSANSVTNFISNIKNIFVGEYEPPINIAISSQSQINENVELGTNETIFIKDGVKLSNGQFLGINELKNMKYLPYNFRDQLCIGDACINKYHIKLIKGKIPFRILTFPKNRLSTGDNCLTLQQSGGDIPGDKSIYQSLSCASPNTEFRNGNLFYFKRDAQPTSTGPVFHDHAAEEAPHDTH